MRGTIGVNDETSVNDVTMCLNNEKDSTYTMDARQTKALYTHYLNSIVKSSSSPWAHQYSNATSRLGTHGNVSNKKDNSTFLNSQEEEQVPLSLFMEEMHYVSVRHWQYLKGIENSTNDKEKQLEREQVIMVIDCDKNKDTGMVEEIPEGEQEELWRCDIQTEMY